MCVECSCLTHFGTAARAAAATASSFAATTASCARARAQSRWSTASCTPGSAIAAYVYFGAYRTCLNQGRPGIPLSLRKRCSMARIASFAARSRALRAGLLGAASAMESALSRAAAALARTR